MMSKIDKKSLDENAVTANAKPADPMPKSEAGTPGQPGYQDLGGPTPMNSKPDDDSNKYKTGGGPTATPPATKPSDASGQTVDSMKGDVKAGHEPEGEVIAEDESEKEVIEVDLSADVQALTEGEDLSEEFKEKAKTIFEAAVVSRLNEELGRMHDEYAKVLEEEIEKVKSDLAEKVDDYLSYSVKNWMDTNSLAIEHGIKNEMAENVLDGIKKVFVENHIELPEEKLDLVDEMTSQLDQMETKLNQSIEENVTLNKEIGTYIKNGIVNEASEGLTLSQREKLSALAEAVEFNDAESYRKQIDTLRESYFSSKSPEAATAPSADVDVENVEPINEGMDAYVKALSRWSK